MKQQETTLSRILIHKMLSRLNARDIEVGQFFTTFRMDGIFYEVYNHKVKEDMDIVDIISVCNDLRS